MRRVPRVWARRPTGRVWGRGYGITPGEHAQTRGPHWVACRQAYQPEASFTRLGLLFNAGRGGSPSGYSTGSRLWASGRTLGWWVAVGWVVGKQGRHGDLPL